MWNLKNGLYIEERLEQNGILNFTTTVLHNDLKIQKNRKEFLKTQFGIKNLICATQTHSDNIEIVTEKDLNRKFYAVDGFITNKQNIPIAVFTADCLPVFIYDKVKDIIGIVHAGRIGLEKQIIKKSIGILKEIFHSNSKDILVAIGPHIKKCCYDVDLDKAAKKQINGLGIKNISIADVCTHENSFFSYRRDKTEKRMLSLIMMEER
ncbi:MAG: hypothetical protein A2539_05345 [Elusimicrobia bacterium RIFOXYD2_FULL_34_15]|nr:MAG: hypothetical protein A2539_05345 [Elusimicrobia bacterium RIFOXYD2_FULL_34_15]